VADHPDAVVTPSATDGDGDAHQDRDGHAVGDQDGYGHADQDRRRSAARRSPPSPRRP
jgi:hypothetical protein